MKTPELDLIIRLLKWVGPEPKQGFWRRECFYIRAILANWFMRWSFRYESVIDWWKHCKSRHKWKLDEINSAKRTCTVCGRHE